MTKPNLSFDVTDPKVREEAASFGEKSTPTGKHIATIKQASIQYTANGAGKLNLVFEIEGGKTYKAPDMFICSGEAKGFAVQEQTMKMIKNMCFLTGSSGQTADAPIKVTTFVDGKRVEEEVMAESYIDLLGKKIGVVIRYYQKYPDSLGMNGYTNRPIPERKSDPDGYNKQKALPTTIWMPDYSKESQPIFDPIMYFDPATGKTLKELQDDECVEGKEVAVEVKKLLEKSDKMKAALAEQNAKNGTHHTALQLSAKAWDELRIKKLKNNLKAAGVTFDNNQFQYSTDQVVDADNISGGEEVDYDDAE